MMDGLRSQPNRDRTKVQWSPTGLRSSSTKVKLLVGRLRVGLGSKYLEGEKDWPTPDQVCGTGTEYAGSSRRVRPEMESSDNYEPYSIEVG
jgi:hypothetical protein